MSSDQVDTSAQKSNIVDSTSYSGIPLKKIHVADISHIYGPGQRGLVADEKIKAGEFILKNDPMTSMSHPIDDKRSTYTLEDFQRLVDEQQDPEAKNYLLRYSLQYDDNSVFVPRNYLTRDTIDLSALMNHSCDANCASKYVDEVFALRDIEPGSVLTVDYGICITDQLKLAAFNTCRCGTPLCAGSNVFTRYKTSEWQNKFYKYCSPYVKRKIDEFREQQNKT
jgi:SET domain-containing protein